MHPTKVPDRAHLFFVGVFTNKQKEQGFVGENTNKGMGAGLWLPDLGGEAKSSVA